MASTLQMGEWDFEEDIFAVKPVISFSLTALAWIVIPRSIHWETENFSYPSWRVYLAICILPSATSALIYAIMPESPKYLLQVII